MSQFRSAEEGFGFFYKRLLLSTLGLAVMLASGKPAWAQLSTANISGTVKDTSGSVIPGAILTLKNVNTGFVRTATTDSAGVYSLRAIDPGTYTIKVSKQGFATASQSAFKLFVGQSTTFDFTLKVGTEVQSVNVVSSTTHLETTSAELGQAINTTEVNDLPLNGRNFTELLDLAPGVSPVSVAQNSGGGGGFAGNAIGTFTFPSVNGQRNRSNFFLLDGLNDTGSVTDVYAVAPIVDAIQEFKVESHNDSAQFGGAVGGIINVVSKSGTNAFHGSAWEFLRNNVFDARNPFLSSVTPFKQNQFGGTIGGPVIFPGYNGKNRTFFFAAYEGFRNHTSSESPFRTPTPAELQGDLSDIVNSSGNIIPIYNPFSTRPDPNRPGSFIRDPFPNNQIPASLLNTGMLAYAKALFPAPVRTGLQFFNGINSAPKITRQDTASLKLDHQIDDRNSLWVRWAGFTQHDVTPGQIPAVSSDIFLHGYNLGVTYTHTFGGNAVATLQLGRDYAQDNIVNRFGAGVPASLWQTAGFSSNFAGDFAAGQGPFNPGINISGFLSFGNGLVDTRLSDIYEFRGDLSKIVGRHTLSAGADFSTNNFRSPIFNSSVGFNAFQTSNLETTSVSGSPLASFLLGVPDNAGRRNVLETEHGGWVDGAYFQDQWHATNKLTVNLGLRYDLTLLPIYGTTGNPNQEVGDLNLNNGTYVLAANAPPCSATQGAPCIPGGTLPAHVVLTPHSNHSIFSNTYDNWQPRLGLAYRLTPNTVLRASAGRFFDNWELGTQFAQAYEGTWPSIGQLLGQNLNNPTPLNPIPTVTAQDPFNLGVAPPLPAPTPFNQVQFFENPIFQDPYSDQWNFGLEHQFGTNTTVSANYVGSTDIRLDLGGYHNTAVTPGPGNPQSRAPYPYIHPSFYDTSNGRSTYNAFQFSLNRRASAGLTYLVSYTYSKSEDIACSGDYGAEGCAIQNPYNINAEHAVSGYDLTHIFSASWVYDLPFGSGRRFTGHNRVINAVAGGWEANGIVTLSSGVPYTVGVSGDIANTGNVGVLGFYERPNLVGNPIPASQTTGQWLSPTAFAVPSAFTFGNLGHNTFRSDWRRNLDLSLFREFPISETKRFEFRVETFNLTNTPVWAAPGAIVNSPTFGEISSTSNIPRQIQLALKFYF